MYHLLFTLDVPHIYILLYFFVRLALYIYYAHIRRLHFFMFVDLEIVFFIKMSF